MGKNIEVRSAEKASALGAHDAEEIQHYIHNSDRQGLQHFFKSFLDHGGQSRVEKALESIKKSGYDPASMHRWLVKGGEVPHAPEPKRNSRHDATSASGTAKKSLISAKN